MMSQDLELEDLSKRNESRGSDGTNAKDVLVVDGNISAWTWVSSVLLGILSSLLTLTPKFLLFVAEEMRTQPTPLEAFLALHFGIFLGATAVSLLLNVPSTDPLPTKSTQRHRDPSLIPLTSAGLLMSFLSYNTSDVGSLSLLWTITTGTIGLLGLWTKVLNTAIFKVMFAGHSSISSKTGADKNTSAFIFGNQSAASVLKKRWKRDH